MDFQVEISSKLQTFLVTNELFTILHWGLLLSSQLRTKNTNIKNSYKFMKSMKENKFQFEIENAIKQKKY